MDIQPPKNRLQTNWQKKLDVTKNWLSQKAGCHKKLVVTKSWMSQKAGCHKKLVVTKAGCHKSWMSEKLVVTKSWMSQKLVVTKAGCHKKLVVTKSWLSQKLVVTKAGCHKKLVVTKAGCLGDGRHKAGCLEAGCLSVLPGNGQWSPPTKGDFFSHFNLFGYFIWPQLFILSGPSTKVFGDTA